MKVSKLDKHTKIESGNLPRRGFFVAVYDSRFKGHTRDNSKEGLLYYWSMFTGTTTNHIRATLEVARDKDYLKEKVEFFIKGLAL